ncbi:MAG: formyltransferase [Synergistes jonesii]|uniref:formyltransferase n=1 Tax=Synergistes jonesii TaxID=2754 RepID=UPI002A7604D5|nr:formyltransferase [Synergistes jonesii]MDY2984674.1 formyltransferase [Synergistes jonesii]
MKSRPRIVLFAYSEVGCLCLEELLRLGANVAGVFTHDDDPDEEIWFRSVRNIALKNGVPVWAPKKLDEDEIELYRSLRAELVFSFYYRAMIPKKILEAPRLGAYNMHGALLPKYRGRACVNWAVLNGETKTGATLHVMTEKADRGDIVDREAVEIKFTDSAHDVFMKVAEAARKIIARKLPELEAGTAPRVPQNEAEATYFGRRRPEDGRIDWNRSAVEVYNLVRAVTHPFPGAFAYIGGRKYYIWRARPIEGEAKPGEIVSYRPLVVGTGKGLLKILSIQPEGGEEGECLR